MANSLVFPIHRRGSALLIDLTAHCLAIIRRRISVTENHLIQLSLSLVISAETTQSNVQVCTELDVFGGQQGSLEYSEARLLTVEHNLK